MCSLCALSFASLSWKSQWLLLCTQRCAKAGFQNRCLKFCGICCEKCNCVPSGTYGNKDECPCYRDLKNSKGKGKCP
ncbi:unnamed protein product [Sphenostylis stenocarpa]|uniref:Snakin-1 n=1 Tax=Sphenostylis stenocarpa TaxID=92480 RepID=A0AA86SYS8_9FABA|nr:unnamed protein product [Sphenostylis stenocarpa]